MKRTGIYDTLAKELHEGSIDNLNYYFDTDESNTDDLVELLNELEGYERFEVR